MRKRWESHWTNWRREPFDIKSISGQAAGQSDWTSITPEEVKRRTGITVTHNAGFSIAAASFHPAKWVLSLLKTSLRSRSEKVEFYSRTKVEIVGDDYHVHTTRGVIKARYVMHATESYTPLLHPQFHDRILPTQTQAASGDGEPTAKGHSTFL